jgi:hypothetical protein
MCQFTDRFYSAVRTLAGNGRVKKRLLAAWLDNLDSLDDTELPEAIRADFDQLRKAMHSTKPIGKEPAPAAAVRKMSPREASRYSTSIVAMFSELVRAKSTGERPKPVKRAEGKDTEASLPRNIALN